MNPGKPNSPSSGDYERPNSRYRCGRGAVWRTPCANGPDGGKCGGTSECQPVLKNGQPECRRPACAGGPCAEGPKLDGSCSHTHPPCVPRLTLRARRGRLVWQLGILLPLLLAAGFHFGQGAWTRPFAADPGPLSAKHAHFASGQGCASCHVAHNADLGGLVKAVFAAADVNSKCGVCHKFAGPADRPHNETSEAHAAAKATDCRLCHTEHRGAAGNITPLTDAQCHACHQVKFTRFELDHPAFPTNFPYFTRGTIQFNHAKHLLDYFKQPQHAAQAQQACVDCHAASRPEKNIRTASFETACARCHADQIPQNELVLLRLPDLPADPAKLGTEDATAFMGWLIQRPGTTNFGVALQQLLSAAAKDGVAALTKTLDAQLPGFNGTPASGPASSGSTNAPDRRSALQPSEERRVTGASLLAGLSPELLQRPAQSWLKREKIETPSTAAQSGWYWMEDLYPELHYKPTGHSDPVTRAWLDYILNVAAHATNADDEKRAAAFRDEIAHPRSGVGRCLKCHVASVPTAQPASPQIVWDYLGSELRPHVKFSHGAHLGVMRCEDCHALNPQADFEAQFKSPATTAGVSNFKSIAVANCTSCHAQSKVRNDCRMCHEYHRGSRLADLAAVPK